MVGARTLAMGLNRLIDAELDARNPRTAVARAAGRRALAGAGDRRSARSRSRVFLVAVFQLDPIVRWLWPIPVVLFVVYPYLKRVTWLCHLWLGASLGLAPVGAWVAVTGELPWQAWALGGAVALWVAGFDLFYSLFDLEHDREQGLHSWAVRFGERGVFLGARLHHLGTVALLAAAGLGLDVGVVVLARRRGGRGAARVRALARPAGRPAAARRGVLHRQRRHQHRLPRLRPARRRRMISARALEKRYGRRRALRPLDFELERGGFLVVTGANGSGKTTLLRLVAGLAAPTGGELDVDAERGGLGYLGHEPLLYRDLTALENLDLYGRLYRVPERRERTGMLLERFGLWDVRAERVALVLARHDAAARALPRAAARPRAARARRAVHRSRRRGSRAARPPARGSSPGRRPCSLTTHDPARVEPLATARLALA